MRNDQVLYAIEGLPERSPLIERVRQEHFAEMESLPPAQRRWYANRDAAIGGNLTYEYFHAGQELPRDISWPAVRRAHRCLTDPGQTRRTDSTCHEVLAFGHPINVQAQAVLKGYLCTGLSYKEIASRVGKSAEFVSLFAHLFCDFHERCDSDEFVLGVLDPRSERGSFQTDLSDLIKIPDAALRLMNIAHYHGPEPLIRAIRRTATSTSETNLLENSLRRLLARAEINVLGDQEYSLLKELLHLQRAKQSGSGFPATPLEKLGFSEGAQITLNGMFQEQITEQLQAAHSQSDTSVAPNPAVPPPTTK